MTTTTTTKNKKHVIIIGAGPSGLVAIKEMLYKGHHVTCLEQSQYIGGAFAQDKVYDTLYLNRGIQRTFFNINTPYSFLRRIQQQQSSSSSNSNNNNNGLSDLFNILSKWSNGMCSQTINNHFFNI